MVPARTLMRMMVVLACLGAAAACHREPAAPDPAQAASDAAANAAFQQVQQAWRAERLAQLTKPDGWASLVGMHWLDPGSHRVGSDTDNGIRLEMGPAHLGVFTVRNGATRFVADTAVTIDGTAALRSALRSDADAQGPSVIAFDEGKGLVTVIARGGRLALRVKHADADSRLRFTGLQYWDGGRDWQVPARFIAHPAGKTLPIANIIGTTDEIPNPGAVEFERGGTTYRMEALDEGGDTLFLVFADRTSGHGSYGAGRFLDAPRPDPQGRLVIDFNQAYNPPCAFTPFATCPLPPPENRLDLAIEAGERDYIKPPKTHKDAP